MLSRAFRRRLRLVVAIEPLGLIAYIAILTRGGRRNTWGFIVGWMLCACVVAVITVVFAGGSHQHDSSQAINWPVCSRSRWVSPRWCSWSSGGRAADASPRASPRSPRSPSRRRPWGRSAPRSSRLWSRPAACRRRRGRRTRGHRLQPRAPPRDRGGDRGVDLDVPHGPDPLRALSERTAAWLDALRHGIERHRDRVIDWLLLGVGVCSSCTGWSYSSRMTEEHTLLSGTAPHGRPVRATCVRRPPHRRRAASPRPPVVVDHGDRSP